MEISIDLRIESGMYIMQYMWRFSICKRNNITTENAETLKDYIFTSLRNPGMMRSL